MTDEITSLQNPRIKAAIKLRDRRARNKQQRILIDGVREIGRALGTQLTVDEAFVCEELCNTPAAREVLAELQRRNVSITAVSAAVFQKLAYGERTEGVLLVANPPRRELADLKLPSNAIVAVLEGLEKPGNVGAVLRSADAAGVSAVLLADCPTDVFNPNCIRASLGTVFTLPVIESTGQTVLDWLRNHRFSIYAARVDGSQDYRQVKMCRPAAVVLGRETAGLSDVWRADNVLPIRLPMLGAVDSLNVSATAAVLFYEALRQIDVG